ncbi:MAG: hypothetical protein K0Q49_85 [Haloplasmataceae bacterium]|jgi:hypothetical protein|nr:hypothetical protein [Haloplasmataceae bacterium]
MNKNGYVLVYALGVITVLMILAASLSNITMNRSIWSNRNVYNIKERTKAISTVEAAASDLALKFDDLNNSSTSYKYLSELSVNFTSYFDIIESNYGVTIRNVSKETCPDQTKPSCYLYTNEYEIIYEAKEFTATKRFFLSMIPSFLYFALGSNSDITFNGGAYIDGDTYVKNNLFLTDVTNYSRNNTLFTQMSNFLTVAPNRSIYIDHSLYSCSKGSVVDCYSINSDNNRFLRNSSNFRQVTDETFYSTTFTNTPPSLMKYSDHFLNVNFDASYQYYLNEATNDHDIDGIDINNISTEINTYITNGWLTPVSSVSDLTDKTGSVVFNSDTVISDHLNYNKDEWIIINGNLTIEEKDIETITIDANILVTGNITITGNIAFDSTIYALGIGNIINAAISGLDTNSLVLLTKENLNFTAINAFRNNFNDHVIYFPNTGLSTVTPHIRGFFYTDANAQVYAAASYIVIEGGLFTNDRNNQSKLPTNINDYDDTYTYVYETNAIGLVINSFRGSVTNDFDFTSSRRVEQSRFVIKHSLDTIRNQPKGLPINTQFNYIFEGVIIK